MKEIKGKSEFESVTQNCPKVVVVISTPTCSLCKVIKNVLEKSEIDFLLYTINANDVENDTLIEELGVMSVPTITCYRNDKAGHAEKTLNTRDTRAITELENVITRFLNTPVIDKDTMFYETQGDLFELNNVSLYPGTTPGDYVLAHCISADIGMFGGIARTFVERMDMKNKILEFLSCQSPTVIDKFGESPYGELVGKSIPIENVYNLVTKSKVSEYPEYSDLRNSLHHMRTYMEAREQKYLAIPKIGCGIDGMDWGVVTGIIREVLEDSGIKTVVVIPE